MPRKSPDLGKSNAPDAKPATLSDGLARLKDSSRKHFNAGCTVGKLKKVLTDEEWQILKTIMEDEAISGYEVARVLQEYGHRITGLTVNRHRRKNQSNGCQCDPD